MESKSEKWQLKRIGTMSFISDECDNIKKSDKSLFANIIRNIFLEVIADFKELESKCKSEYQRGIEDGKIIAEHGTTMYQD